MHRFRSAVLLNFAFTVACALVCAGVCAQTGYTLMALGGLGASGGRSLSSAASGVNSKGQVAGFSAAYDAQHNYLGYKVFLYANGQLVNLGSFGVNAKGVNNSFANALNYHVAAVGDCNNDGFNDLVWQDSTSGDVYV